MFLQLEQIYPDICVMCQRKNRTSTHLFLLCEMAQHMWRQLFRVRGEHWVCPTSIMDHVQIRYFAFLGSKDRKILWHYAFLSTFGVFGWRDSRMLSEVSHPVDFVWDGLHS